MKTNLITLTPSQFCKETSVMMPPAFPEVLPAAWLGYRPHAKQFCAVAVCAWCPDKARAETLARPFPVTHGICPACFDSRNKKLIPNF
jgi:hypothetical protein